MANVILIVREGSIVGAYGDTPVVVEVLDYDLAEAGSLPGYLKHGAETISSLSTETWDALAACRQQAEGKAGRANGVAG